MGLFGGFKAKFTKESNRKLPKCAKGAEVVCLGYRVQSEFDDLPRNTTETKSYTNLRHQKTEIPNHNKEASTSSVTSSEKRLKKKVPAVPKIHIKETEKTVENVNHNIIINGSPTEASSIERRPKSIYTEGKTSNPKKEIKSILKGIAPPPPPPPPPPLLANNEELVSDHHQFDDNTTEISRNTSDHDEHQSNFIFTTHNNNKNYTRTTAGAITSSRLVLDSEHTTDIQTLVHAEVTEHNVSSDSTVNHVSFGRPISHTSKQATSIFFDGDDEPEFQQRPRRLQISSDDDRRSSADC